MKTCDTCMHEFACKMWTGGRSLSAYDAKRCPKFETIMDSAAYFLGRFESQKDIDGDEKTAIGKNAQVIYTPIKAGSDIYRIYGEKICYLDVNRVEIYKGEIAFVDNLDNYFFEQDIGKTVFLTREEAEKALERSKDNG